MATAEVKTEKVTKTVEVEEKFVTLKLTDAEARTLKNLLGVVSGYDQHGHRERTQKMYRALDEAGYGVDWTFEELLKSNPSFKSENAF